MNDHPACTLSIVVSRFDTRFIQQTIPHLVRACNYPFSERMLVMDTLPRRSHRRYSGQQGLEAIDELRDLCRQLVSDGVMDSAVEIDYSDTSRVKLYQKHLSRMVPHTHNFRGAPILGYMFSIEAATSPYLLHFDSDILLHQKPGHSWIEDGIRLLNDVPEVVAVSPLSGPPSPDGSLKQDAAYFGQETRYERDPRGFYSFSWFTSRKFLIDRRKFDSLLPLVPRPRTWKHWLTAPIRRTSPLAGWEVMVSDRLCATGLVRADLDSPDAWTLHTPDHGPLFIESLPEIIRSVEAGWYPPEQAGDYDLRLDHWQKPTQ